MDCNSLASSFEINSGMCNVVPTESSTIIDNIIFRITQ